jgi:hypothetical protein
MAAIGNYSCLFTKFYISDEIRIVFLIYKNLSEFMSPGTEEEDDDYYVAVEEDTNQVSNETEPFINTNIFSVAVNGRKTQLELSQPLTFTLKHNQVCYR